MEGTSGLINLQQRPSFFTICCDMSIQGRTLQHTRYAIQQPRKSQWGRKQFNRFGAQGGTTHSFYDKLQIFNKEVTVIIERRLSCCANPKDKQLCGISCIQQPQMRVIKHYKIGTDALSVPLSYTSSNSSRYIHLLEGFSKLPTEALPLLNRVLLMIFATHAHRHNA